MKGIEVVVLNAMEEAGVEIESKNAVASHVASSVLTTLSDAAVRRELREELVRRGHGVNSVHETMDALCDLLDGSV